MDAVSYILSRKYTEDTAIGLGAVKGKPCNIQSITPTDDGNKVTFRWTGDDGTVQTSAMLVKNGIDGESIVSIEIDANNRLKCTLTDGAVIVTNPLDLSAEKIDYTNAEVSGVSNVQQALDKLFEGGVSSEEQIKDWVSGETYEIGDYVYYDGKLYRCTTENSDVDFSGINWKNLSGSEGGTGEGLTTEQANQLTTAYEHSQTPHVSADDIPTNISDLTNDSGFITNSDLPTVPTKVSDLENDSNFVTNSKMLEAIANAQLGNGEDSDIDLSVYQPIEESTLTTTAKTIPTAINELKSGLDDKVNKTDITTTINSTSTDTQIPSAKATYDLANTKANTNHTHNTSDIKGLSIPTKVSDLENDRGYLASIPEEYITETELENKGYLTSHQDISGLQTKTDDSLTTTSKEVVGAINELKKGVSSISVPTKVSQLTNDSGYLSSVPSEYVTETKLNAKGYLTEHQDISNLALKSEIPDVSSFITSDDLPTVPTKVSELTNDSNFITSIPSEYVTETELKAKKYLTSVPSTYALKTDIPTVPTKTSQLTNDSNFITSIPEEYITETELNAKGYLTSHQDISGLQTKTDKNLATTSKEVVGAINEVKSLNDTKLNKTDANKLNCVVIDTGSLKEYILTNFTEAEQKTYHLIANPTCTDLPKASNFYITVETPGMYTYKVTAKELNDSNGSYVCTYRTTSSSWTKWEKVCTTTVANVEETSIEFDETALGLSISNNRSIYKVINGICYVTIELLVDAPSENKSYGYTKVNTTSLPEIGFNTKYFLIVEGANSFISAVLDKGTTDLKLHGNIPHNEGTYIIQGSFSYPVAE